MYKYILIIYDSILLQVGSVTAPRKIIDIDFTALKNTESTHLRPPCKTRKILLEIEWVSISIAYTSNSKNSILLC